MSDIKTQAIAFTGLSNTQAALNVLELVKDNALKVGLFPSVKAAQMILESAYITSELAKGANNCFGMKKSLSGNTWSGSTWDGKSVYRKETKEQKPDGTEYTITAEFRKYACLEDSIADHSAYLLGAKNGNVLRYERITKAKNYKEQITRIKEGGYATDASYVKKVCDVIEKFGLDRYDKNLITRYRVCLDAGHYGKYNQGVVKTYYEAEVMWKLHQMVGDIVSKMGIDVIYTRTDQKKDLDTITRGTIAKGCDLLISFHSNAADPESVDYPVSIVQSKNSKVASQSAEIGLQLAKVVQDVMKTKQNARTMTKLTDDKSKEWYGILRVDVPAIIVENSFHTNQAATNWLLNDSNLNQLADEQAKCIVDFLNGIKNNSTITTLPTIILRKGSKGDDVKVLQEQLNILGYGLVIDGEFGSKTDTAVREFQKAKGLVVDGIVGVRTWAAFNAKN